MFWVDFYSDEENSDVDVDDAGSTTDMFDELDIDLNVTKPEIVVLPRKPPLPTIECVAVFFSPLFVSSSPI